MCTIQWIADREEQQRHGSDATDSIRRTPPRSTRPASSGSVFARGRASKQRQTPSRRTSLSPAASRTSSGETAVAFGSTFSPKTGARMDNQESPRSIGRLRQASAHSDISASAESEQAAGVDRRSPLGNRRPRQDSPVERSLRCVLPRVLTIFSLGLHTGSL